MDSKTLAAEAEEEKKKAKEAVASVVDESTLNEFKGTFLGKKSKLTEFFRDMKEIPVSEKKEAGMVLTDLRMFMDGLLSGKAKELSDRKLSEKLSKEMVDITLPGYRTKVGGQNPFYRVVDEITDFFLGLGYTVADGPEVESDKNNFELLNIPKDHPARDMQDSFSISPETVLRSHTSCVQARVMAAAKGVGPLKVICPGKVYRRDNDATHSHQFGQIEGLVISKDATFSNLLETLTMLLKHLFGEKREVRFRPSFFPFTEPSVEADISCFACNGKGCALCKHTGFIEVLGSGMVHPNVLRMNGFDDSQYQGFAFGIGIDRIAMLQYGIDDIKRFYTDDVSFLEEFEKGEE
ncbi:MAG: phenylalanine--tRNA ligase subunit alpha [Bacilli bacterium]|jgi:phenylalanyl-tRNA synthetase alpha chain|nr:phenylalanine--tRNA ligase subunit alpha [Bacilli bacterium]